MNIKAMFGEINKEIPVPLYYQFKQKLLTYIKDGTLQVGDMLTPETEFSAQLGISRPTIRQALSELVMEGYLVRQKGRGTFIAKPKVQAGFFQKLQSFNEEMLQKGFLPSTQVLKCQKVNGIATINARLLLQPKESLICLERLRFADGEPLVLLETYLDYARFGRLLEVDFTKKSLYILLEERYQVCVQRVAREMEAVNARTAEAKVLQIPVGKAICLVNTIAYDADNLPVEYSIARYRGDRNRFTVELFR